MGGTRRWVHAVVATATVAALLAVQPAAAQTTDGAADPAPRPNLEEVFEWAEATGAFDAPRAVPSGRSLRLLEATQEARTTGERVPFAITDCNNSIYSDPVGDVPFNDIEETGSFGDCAQTMFDAFTVDPLDTDEFFAFGGYYDEDQDDATGCFGYDFLVVTFDLLGDNAFVQEQPTCDPATWFVRTEIPVSVVATPSVGSGTSGYISVLFQSSFLLGGEGSYEWYQLLQSDTVVDFSPDVVDFTETLVPITPDAPINPAAAPASGGGVHVSWDHTGGDTTGFELQWRRASGVPASASSSGEPPPPPVVGGSPISISEAPWTAAVFAEGTDPAQTQFCGGVLVTPVKVVTAAHCVATELPEDLEVLIGQTDLSLALESQISRVLSVDVYPGYDRSLDEGDIAVLSLARPFNNVSPLPRINTNPNVPLVGTPAQVSGWGAVDAPGGGLTFTNLLQEGEVFVQASPGQPCGSWPPALFVPEHHLCASDPGLGIDSCFGDSGGGLITTDGVHFDLVGIVSFGNGGCGDPGFPTAYARVSTYASWLNAAIGSAAWAGQSVACTTSRCSFRVPDLIPGQRYEFRVAGVNAAGTGPWSTSVFANGGNLLCLGRVVTIIAEPNSITTGTAGPDVIWGTEGPDDIRSGAGNDTICANAGNDRVSSGGGADRVDGGSGDDNISLGRGADVVTAGAGDDLVRGQGGRDTLNGGLGADEIDGGVGNDTLNGNGGRDRLTGGRGRDIIRGGNGNDVIEGNQGDDTLTGNGGRDRFVGGPGNDTINGGGGRDTLNGSDGFDVCNGGRGNDRYSACERIS